MRAALGGVDRIAPEPVLMVLSGMVDKEALARVEPARVRLCVSGIDAGDWLLSIGAGEFAYVPMTGDAARDVDVEMDVATWTDIVAGRVTAPAALIEGRVRVTGDVMKALTLDALL
jgi:hypothetical protein